MSKPRIIVISILLALTLAIVLTQNKNLARLVGIGKNQQSRPIEESYEITGIFRDMFLDEETKAEIMLTTGRYQLVQLNPEDVKTLPYDVTGIYLESTPEKPNTYLGKCVTIKGTLDKEWFDKTTQAREDKKRFIFDQIAIKANSIEKMNFKECSGYPDISASSDFTSAEKVILTGVIERIARDQPDIGPYDYIIEVPEEDAQESTEAAFVAELRAEGYIVAESLPTDRTRLVPMNNSVWEKLEINMREKAAIEGYKLMDKNGIEYVVVKRFAE